MIVRVNVGNDQIVHLTNGRKVFVQTQTEAAHAQVEKQSDGQHKSCDNVEPFLSERSRVGVFGEYRIAVEIGENLLVACVCQVVDSFFQHVADDADDLVVARTEKHLDGIRQSQQFVLVVVVLDGVVHILQMAHIVLIVWVFDDDFLAADVAMEP